MAGHGVTLIYVHGAGFQPPEADWIRLHDVALFPGGPPPATDLAYYADLAHADRGPVPALTSREDVRVTEPVEAHDVAAHVHPSAQRVGRAREAELFLLRLAAAMGPSDHRSRFALPSEVIPAPVRAFYHEVTGYLHGEPELAEGMRERLRATIRRHDDRLVLLAHSLGSLVAFDVLGEAEFAGRDVSLLTVGSPLGLGPAQEHLRHWRGSRPIELPAGVSSWRNFHADGDPVAHGSDLDGLRHDFSPAPRIHSTTVRNEAEWHHALGGYLETPEVRDAVYARLFRAPTTAVAASVSPPGP